MANQSYFFDHDYSSRNDDKILEMRSVYKGEGYGIFWMILETMAENENGGFNKSLIGGLSGGYGVAKGWLSEFIDYCLTINLFYEKEGYIFSKRMLQHKSRMQLFSESGKKGATKRWGNNRGAMGGLSGGYAGANAERIDKKERKEERAVGFSADYTEALFEDGTKQKLGQAQLLRIKEGGFEPQYVKKGIIE